VGIHVKLLGAFVLVALFAGLLGVFSIESIEQLSNVQSTTYRDVFGGTHLLATWVDRAWHTRRAVLAYAVSDQPAQRAALREQIAAADVELQQLTQSIDDADTDREEVDPLAGVVTAWSEYREWRDAALAAADAANDPGIVASAYKDDGARLDAALDNAIDHFLTSKNEAGAQYEMSAQVTYEQMRRLAMALSLAAALVAVGVGLAMSRHVAGAAREIASAAEGLARGELDQRIAIDSSDELGRMAASFRSMIEYQQHMAQVANAIARGDLSHDVEPKSDLDVLGTAFRHMAANLRQLVTDLQRADEWKRRAAVRTATLNEQTLRRIGADLHDGPCQSLAFALIGMDSETATTHTTATIRSAVTDALAELRTIAAGLRPPELLGLSLRQVVERGVRTHERRSGARVRVDLDGLTATDAEMSVKVALFRALQEALSNAARHARGAEVTVRAWLADDWLWLTIADRGPGFPESGAATERLGLASMRERAELLGGQFRLASAPGCGTQVQLCWPLSPQIAADIDTEVALSDAA
jgi:signal transduction histidine kinase